MGLIDRWKRVAASTMSSAGGSSAVTSSMPDTSPSSERAPSWMTDRMRGTVIDGRDDLEVVGESFYQPNLWHIVGGHTRSRVRSEIVAVLVAEHDNRYDAKAVSVWISGLKVGHLSREDAARIRPGLISLQRKYARPVGLVGVITGGGADDGRRGNLGVFLNYDEADFGLATPAEPTSAGVRTGLSEALTTDVADDGYDLGWFHSLPDDASKRLIRLRKLLLSEESPLSRHYIFSELEALLYRFRDTFPSALPEYDEVCRKHDTDICVVDAETAVEQH